MYAVTPSPLSWTSITDASGAPPGSIIVDTIPDGVTPTNSFWDTTLNGGTGGIAPMTPSQLAVVQTAQNAQLTTADQTEATLFALLSIMTGKTPTPPYTNLSTQQLTTCLVALVRTV